MVLVLKRKSAKSLRQQMDELLEQKKELPQKRMWNKFFGKVKFSDSPIQYQRKLRDE